MRLQSGDGAKLHGGDDTNPTIPYTITEQLGWAAVKVNKHSPVNLECMTSALRGKKPPDTQKTFLVQGKTVKEEKTQYH